MATEHEVVLVELSRQTADGFEMIVERVDEAPGLRAGAALLLGDDPEPWTVYSVYRCDGGDDHTECFA